MARSFGAADYIQFPAASNAEDAISFWIKTTSVVVNAGVITRGNTSSRNGWLLYLQNTGGAVFQTYNGGGATASIGSAAINDGNWHHVGINTRYDNGGTSTLYIDGVSAGTANNSAACGGTEIMRIGRSHDAFWGNFVGEIAEFATWGTGSGVGAANISARDFVGLAASWCPLNIRRRNNRIYVPFIEATPRGYIGADDVVTVSGTTQSAHPRRIFG